MPSATPTPASLSRRRFLTLSGAASVALFASTPVHAAASAPPDSRRTKIPIGIELYAVRGELTRDLPGTLRRVAKIGYEVVEFYSPYVGWTFPYAKEVRTLLDDLGLRCYSTHNGAASLTDAGTM